MQRPFTFSRGRRAAIIVALAALGLTVGMTGISQASGVTVTDLNNGATPAGLAESLAGGGVTISNVTYTGADRAAGTFTDGAGSIGFENGIVLDSGKVETYPTDEPCSQGVEGPNTCYEATEGKPQGPSGPANSTQFGEPGDAELTLLSGFQTYDASVLEFNFVPQHSTVQFSYVFGSEEYSDFANTQFNDVFAFLVNGTNCALVPGTMEPVSVNTINNGNDQEGDATPHHPEFFRDNVRPSPSIESQMDGLTTVLTCTATVKEGQENHIKLAIADASDERLDSAVFIQAKSLVSGTQISTSLTGGGQSGEKITVPEGTAVTDHATLSGATASKATGTVNYKVYSDSECKKLVSEAGEVEVTGGAVPASTAETLAPGTYYWQASYGGDSNNNSSTSECGAETTTVVAVGKPAPAPTQISTSLSGGGQSGGTVTVKEGTAVTDRATLSGENASKATGKVSYTVYSDKECSTAVAEVEAGEVEVAGGKVPASNPVTLSPGTYYWQASYGGDEANEKSSSTCGSEVETVEAPPTSEEPQPHWYSNGKLIPEGEVEPVPTSGELTLQVPGSKLSVTCKVKDKGTIVNPPGGGAGTDENTEIVFSSCSGKASPCSSGKTSWCCKKKSSSPCEKGSKIEISSPAGTLRTHLVATHGQPIRDVIEGVVLEVKCSNGTVLDTYKGTLMPSVGSSVLQFGAGSGELEEALGGKATVSGSDKLKGPKGDEKITAKLPPLPPHWYSNGKLIHEGEVEPVSSSGELTLQVPGSKLSVSCKVKDKATIVNPAAGGAGTDETTEVVFSSCSGKASPCSSGKTSWCCKKKSSSPCEKGSRIEISSPAGTLPSHLTWAPGQPVRDVIEDVVLEVRCSNGTVLDTYKGTLMPTVGNSVLQFGAGSGELEEALGGKATVSGSDKLKGPKGDERITVENPESESW